MRNLLIDVGDGQCLLAGGYQACGAQIDCGSQQGGRLAAERWRTHLSCVRLHGLRSLWLTHYHSDHYNGLVWASASGMSFPWLRNLTVTYSPGLPDPAVTQPFVTALFTLAAYTLGDETGIMDVDFRRVAARLAGLRSVRHRRVFQGDVVELGDGREAQVFWPPRKLPPGSRRSIEKAVARFKDLLRDDSRARLRNLFDQAQNLSGTTWTGANDEETALPDEKREGQAKLHETQPATDPELTAANRALREAANHLGLAFAQGADFLCLGDLTDVPLRSVLEILTRTRQVRFRTVIAPHHGTVWCDELLRLRARCVAVSVGDRLWRHVVPCLGLVAPKVKLTRLQGTVAF